MAADIALFFEPIADELADAKEPGTLGERIQLYRSGGAFPNLASRDVVLFGISENRRSLESTTGDAKALTTIRRQLYQLKDHFPDQRIIDLGNIGPGETVEDTYYAVSSSVAAIVKQGGTALLLGGSQDLTYANYLAYEKLEQVVNLVCVDSRFDLGDADVEPSAACFLQKIVLHQPNMLFNFSNLGYQTHHVLPKEVELMKKMYFDAYRLGEVHEHLEQVEPVLRNADIVSMDLDAIRSSDLRTNSRKEPNGLFGQEACAIARYTGLSDKLSSFGIYDCLNCSQEDGSAQLIAQIIWYFLWGVANRKQDYPFADKSEYTRYTVTLEDGKYDVIFYKSGRSDRWWMEVPYPSKRGSQYERHFMIPCGYEDYRMACQDEIPDRWWQTYQKLG